MRHIAELPEARAAADPHGPCVADDHETLSNTQFRDRVATAASVLHRAGVRPDDVVAVVLANRIDLVVVLFAAWRLGAALTPVNPGLTDDDVRYQVEDSGARVVVGEHGRPATTLDVGTLTEHTVAVPAVEPVDRLALIIYTSGTTGRPKGVLLGHENLAAMCAMIIDSLGLNKADHSLLILPLFHVNGIVVSVVSPLLAGGRTTIAGKFSASAFFDTVARVRPTYFSAVPAIYAMLLAQPAGPRPDGSSLRLAICGAAPMAAELITRFEQRFGVPIVEGYGLSEGTCASTLNPVTGRRKPGTVGVPLPGQTVAIMAADGALSPPGEPGEVVVRGPNVMRGYLGKPTETADTVVDGWLHTGDVGYFDDDGYLVLVDRIKDMIIRAGENLYPKEIENALYRHAAVHEAAVVGVPDDVLGEVPVAHVVAAPGATVSSSELLAHCRAELAGFKVPAAIVLTEEMPRNPVGKIDKKKLRALAARV
ncbi:class I adenylate-forming enzyme family protein [Nocardia caishijiensis]|uniref:Acyl-CoA synthetase (AMP-forming)/AMP-acid ligase II n=1 Tax=Nocardia caishijiensis TaxID=184756 RepID=A0ABQ6YLL4_9NOCA|nr:AMP-binding protein [Nocardia caishijiensis]KAF0846684.1 acyl-CoA synthetase (AMP-forming)/AMP-acid ligase II [Nocardia caishijiensis]